MSSEPENVSFRESIADNRRAVIVAVAAVAALAVMCVLAFVLLRPSGEEDEASSDRTSTPTPFPTTAASPEEPASNEPLVVGISDTDTISVSVDVPVFLSVGGQKLAVRTQVIGSDGQWNPLDGGEKTVAWVYGTIVNYVLGMPDSDANRALFGELTPGESMVLTTRAGVDYTFNFSSRETVESNNSDIFTQTTPGLTLVLSGAEGAERTVIKGRYVVPEATGSSGSPVVELGETTQLDDIQLTATGASYVLDRPEAPSGFAFYMIDYQIQNVGLSALDTSILQLVLMDNLGNQYAVSPAASQIGNHPPLAGFMNSNQNVEATAAYQVPIGLNSAALNWIISRSDTNGQVQVTVPFSGGSEVIEGTDITLNRAEVSADLTSLVLGGQVTNSGEQPVLVTEGNVTLTTDDGSAYLILSTNPPFPWTVASQQTVQFQVSFQWPLAEGSATFTVLNQSFALNSLPQ
jgi:hypothetical protein